MRISACILIALFILASCAKEDPTGSEAHSNRLASASQLNSDAIASNSYAALLQESSFVPYDADPAAVQPDLGAMLQTRKNSAKDLVPTRQFSRKELNRLGVWVLPDHKTKLWTHDTYMMITGYYRKHGVLPGSSTDIVKDMLTAENVNQMVAHPEFDITPAVAPLIDWSTGKLYTNFQSTAWAPFGIKCSIIPKTNWTEVIPELKNCPNLDKLPFSGIMHIRMYGENPGSVLEEGNYYLVKPEFVQEKIHASQGSCGCQTK